MMLTSLPLVAPPEADAMTTIRNGSGLPGDSTTAQVRNDAAGPSSSWTITAPANTTITSAIGSNPSGTRAFSCTIDVARTSATCSAGPIRWAAGNVVTLELLIDTNAPAGTFQGTSSLPWESGTYAVTVLAPPAPELTAPRTGSTSQQTRPMISGTKRAGHSVSVFADGAPICTVPANQSTTWQCRASRPLQPGTHRLTATQTSPGQTSSEASAVSAYTVIAPPAEAPPTRRSPDSSGPRAVGPPAANPPRLHRAPRRVSPEPPPATYLARPPERESERPRNRTGPTRTPRAPAIAINLKLADPELVRGSPGTVRGTLGPNQTASTTQVTFTSVVPKGLAVRSISVAPDGDCNLDGEGFTCTVSLKPGQSAAVSFVLLADGIAAPNLAKLQLAAAADGVSNGSTLSLDVVEPVEQISGISDESNLTLTVLILLLFALAAGLAEREQRNDAEGGSPW